MIQEFPRVVKLVLACRVFLFLIIGGILLAEVPQQHSTTDRISVIEQRVDDQQRLVDERGHDLGELKKAVMDSMLRTEARLSTLERSVEINNELMYVIVGALLVQMIETMFSYARASSRSKIHPIHRGRD